MAKWGAGDLTLYLDLLLQCVGSRHSTVQERLKLLSMGWDIELGNLALSLPALCLGDRSMSAYRIVFLGLMGLHI
ncbi:hypothetical protein F4808DRAFT_462463 [Astrocystis sublimbata]|nr:hypothetical protein F4808DRAFT_462463 [Astrocystis sublimbata]